MNMPIGSEKEKRLTDRDYRGRKNQTASGNASGMLLKQQMSSKFRLLV